MRDDKKFYMEQTVSIKTKLTEDDLFIAKKEYERGKSLQWIEDKYKFSRAVVGRAAMSRGWKGREELKRELFNTAIEIPQGLELPTNHQIVLQNLTITDRWLNMLLMMADEMEFDCIKVAMGYEEEQEIRSKMGNVKGTKIGQVEMNPAKYGFKSMGEFGDTLMKALDKRYTFAQELPDLVKSQDLQSDIERVAKKLQMEELKAYQRSEVPGDGVVYMERTAEEEQELRRLQREIEEKGNTQQTQKLADRPKLKIV